MANRNTLSTDPDRVRERMDASRQEVADSLLSLRERIRMRTDWRASVRRAPTAILGGAFAVGFAIALLSSRKRNEE